MLPFIAAIPSILQAGIGISQIIGGNRQLGALKRPEYQIPGEAKAALALDQQAYADPYSTGELRAQNNIGLASANAIASARDGGNASAMAPAIQAQQSAAYNTLSTQVEADQERRRAALMSSLGMMAQYRDQAFQINKMAPYADQYAEGRQRIGAGQQNLFSALDAASTIAQMTPRSNINPAAAASASTNTVQSGQGQQSVFDSIISALAPYASQAAKYYNQMPTAGRKL